MAVQDYKQGDTWPFIGTCKDENGPVNLSGCTARFHMRPRFPNGPAVIDQPCQITDAVNGGVRYDWQAHDLDVPGLYYAEVEITFGDGTVESFPKHDIGATLRVVESIA